MGFQNSSLPVSEWSIMANSVPSKAIKEWELAQQNFEPFSSEDLKKFRKFTEQSGAAAVTSNYYCTSSSFETKGYIDPSYIRPDVKPPIENSDWDKAVLKGVSKSFGEEQKPYWRATFKVSNTNLKDESESLQSFQSKVSPKPIEKPVRKKLGFWQHIKEGFCVGT